MSKKIERLGGSSNKSSYTGYGEVPRRNKIETNGPQIFYCSLPGCDWQRKNVAEWEALRDFHKHVNQKHPDTWSARLRKK